MAQKITGADLLKGFYSGNNSSTNKEEEGKKKKVTGADILAGANEIWNYRTIDTSGVNEDYINSFISDANNFFKGAEETYNSVGWGNASSVYDSTNSAWKEIQNRGTTIKAWLYKNKSRLNEDSYKSLTDTLSSIDSNANWVIEDFENASKFYSSFETEDAYNDWKANEDWKKEFMSKEDFEEKSQYQSTVTYYNNLWMTKPKIGDALYEYVNNQKIKEEYAFETTEEGARSKIKSEGLAYSLDTKGDGETTYEEKGYDYLTDDEVKIFNYYYATEGKEKAQEYLNSLEQTLQYREANEIYGNIDSDIGRYLFGVYAGVEQFKSGIEGVGNAIFGNEQIVTDSTQIVSSMVREDLSSIGKIGYDLLNTTANMLPSILIGAVTGGVGGTIALGASAAGNGYNEMISLGYNKNEARAYGVIVGVSEAVLQYVLGGIGKLGGSKSLSNTVLKALDSVDNAIGRVSLKLGAKMASEGLEESIQSVLEPVFKSIVTGEEFEGIDWGDVAYSGLLGALSAGALEGVGTVKNDISTKKLGQQVQNVGAVDRLTKLGSTFSADSVAYKLAGKVNENTGAYTIGKLLNEVGGTLTEQNQSEIIKSLTRKGMTEKDAKIHAKWLSKLVEGEALTAEQIDLIENNDVVSKTFYDVIVNQNSTVNQRLQGYNEAIDQVLNGGKAKTTSKTAQNQAEISETGIPSAENENAQIEGNTEAEEKKTVLVATGEEVSVAGISSIKDGVVTVRLEDGREVNAKDIDYSNKQEGLVYEAVADMSQEKAQDFIDGLQEGNVGNGENQISLEQYLRGFNNAYRHGTFSIPTTETANDTFASQLTDRQRKLAYNRGKADSISKVKADQAKADEKKATLSKTEKVEGESAKDAQSSKVTKKGKVTYLDGATPKGARQKSAVKAIEVLSESIGNNWYVFSSYVDENGKRVYKDIDGKIKPAPNGKYDTATGDIYIDLNAGQSGEGLMVFTMAHELTHLMRQWSPEKFKVFADFLLEQYGKKGVSVEGLIQSKISNAKKNGRELTYDEAYEEVIADSAETMLRDSNALEVISKLKAKDKSIWGKIKDFISNMVNKIRAAYAKLNPDSVEGRMVLEMKGEIEKLQALWTEGLLDAAETYSNAIVQVDTKTQSVAPTMFSERTWTESEYVQEREETAKKIAKSLNISVDVAKDYIDDINSVASLIADDRARLDYEPNLDDKATVLKKNSDYKFSVDMSTLCAKRLLFTGTFDAIQRQLPDTAFDSDDIVRIRAMMEERGYEVACGICYVESTRREIGTITADFINSYKEAQKTGKPIARVNSEGKSVELKKTKEQLETTVDATTDKFYAEKDYTPTLADLNTTDIDLVKKEHPAVYEAYLNFMNARGQAKPKLLETRAEYKGEILKNFKAKSAVDARNNAGGLRLQSFSDFEVPHLIDMMQITMDMARVGLKAQAYTKVPNFADAFGNTGIKINLSLIAKGSGLDSNGNLIFDDKEGINHKEAFRLRDKFSKNVGTILVGKNDAHIVAAMADPRIDYIIPFHKSSWKESLYDALGLTGYADYTDFQNEKYLDADRGKAKNFDPSEYWDYSKTGDENAQIYLEKCREDGRIPKFPQFQGYKGYWKLLIDFKMYDNDGVGSPQEVVRPIFDNATNEKILNEYKGGHRSFPEAKDVVSDFVKEYKDGMKHSDRDLASPSNPDIRYSFRDSDSGMANDALSPYDDELKGFIERRGDYIVDSFDKLQEIVNMAFDKPQLKATAYFGIINTETLEKIKNSTHNLPKSVEGILFKKGRDYSIAVTLDSIRHMVDEKSSLTREDIIDFLDRLADTIVEFDTVAFSFYEKKGERIPGLLFDKKFSDGTLSSYNFVSQGKRSLVLQSFYMDSGDYQKKKSAETLLLQKATTHTSKTQVSQTSDKIVSEKDKSVKQNSNISENSQKLSERDPELAEQRDKINKVLEKENAELREDNQYLKELVKLQRKVTHGKKFTKSSVEAVASKLMKSANAKGNRAELVNILNEYYEYIANGESLAWEEVAEKAQPAIEWLKNHISYNVQMDTQTREILNNIRSKRIYLDDQQQAEVAYVYGSFFEYRKKAMGSLTIVNKNNQNGAVSLDSQWQEFVEMYPEYFDPDVTTNDMPMKLMEVVEALRNTKNGLFEYEYSDEMVEQELLSSVYDSYWDVSTLYTVADSLQKEITALKIKHRKKLTNVREYHNEKHSQLKKEYQEKISRIKKDARDRDAKITRELMNRYQESRERATEYRNKTELRNKIKKVVGNLNTLLLNPTKDKHIKEELRTAVAEALSAVNMDTIGAEERVAKYNALIAKTNDPDMIAELTKTRDRIELWGDNLKEKLTALQTAYEKVKNSTDPELKNAYQEAVMNSIKATVELVGNTSLRDMTLSQLDAVYEMYSMILHTVRTANKAFKAQKGETITQLSEAVNSEIRTVGKEKFTRSKLEKGLRKTGWTLLKPLTAFRTIGSDTFTRMYKELRNGEDVYYVDLDEGKAFRENMYKKYGFESWDQKQTKTFKAKSGKDFTLTLEQIMSIYAYSRRNQAHAHIIEGGIVLENSVIETKNKLGLTVKRNVDTKTAFNISEETLTEICDTLTKEQKAFVEDMQAYLSDVLGAKGNEVSMELLGVKLFKEKFYFPLKSSKYYMGFKPEEAGEIKLKNPAFSKETVHHANNPVVLENFMDVWAEHLQDMSMYHAFVLPLEDFTRVYNYKTKTDENVETTSTEATIANAFGEGATKYIRNFLKSLNGGVRTESVGAADKLTALAKKGAVLGSASVAIQQPSAIIRAMALINPKYFVKTSLKSLNLLKHNQDWAELKRYAPIAGIKEMGRFDVGMGQSTLNWIKGQNSIKEKVDEAISKAPAFMDEVTWVGIWNAVKNEVKHTNKGIQVGSEAYFKKCGERFTDVISLTQVYDSVFSRSELMRNPSWIAKAVTAFMAEPSTTLNMLVDSFIQGKRTGNFGGFAKTTVGTTGAIVGSIVLNSALKSIITAMRDDDEDESYSEKYIGAFVGNMKDGFNPLTYIPIAKDIVSIFQGYDVERMDMALFSDIKNAIDAFDSDSKSSYEKWTGLIGAISAFAGVPFKNVERDIRGVFNTIKSFSDGEQTTDTGIEVAIKEAWAGENISNSQQLYDAIMSGDQEHVERVKGRFDEQSEIDSAIKKALRENDSRIHDAAVARMNGDITGYTRIAKEIIAEGYFKQDYVVGAINAEINAIKREEEKKNGTTEEDSATETDEVSSIYSTNDINVAFNEGDTALGKQIIQDLIDTKVANGMDEKNAKSSLRSAMTSYWKKLYLEAYRNGDTAEMYRIRLILLNSGLYGNSNSVVETVQGWLKG